MGSQPVPREDQTVKDLDRKLSKILKGSDNPKEKLNELEEFLCDLAFLDVHLEVTTEELENSYNKALLKLLDQVLKDQDLSTLQTIFSYLKTLTGIGYFLQSRAVDEDSISSIKDELGSARDMVLEDLGSDVRSTADADNGFDVWHLQKDLKSWRDKMKERVDDRLKILQMTVKAECAVRHLSCKRKRGGGSRR